MYERIDTSPAIGSLSFRLAQLKLLINRSISLIISALRII